MHCVDIVLPDEDATHALGDRLGAWLEPGDTVILEGDLGAGKTTLVRAIARGMGVPETIAVTSPTFALVHELPGRHLLAHADLYRLDAPEEIVEIGLLETIGRGGAVTCIEWGERFLDVLGPPTLLVRLAFDEGAARRARIESSSPRGTSLLDSIRAANPGLG